MSAPSQFVNKASQDLVIGGFGNSGVATFRVTLKQNQSTVLNLIPGDRVFVAWDSFLFTFHPNNPGGIFPIAVADVTRVRYTIADTGWSAAVFPGSFPPIPGVTPIASGGA